MSLIYLDTETTDITAGARLVQLAHKEATGGQLVNEYFKPPVPISFSSMAAHHITNEMVAQKPIFAGSQQQEALKQILQDGILVAHNASFDILVLKNEGVKTRQYIDTLRVSRHLLDSEQYALQYLRYFLGLNIKAQAHDALGDVLVLEGLYQYLVILAAKRFGLKEQNEITQKMLDLTQLPVVLENFNFGKYKGRPIGEVSEVDPGYLQWLYESETQRPLAEQNEDLVYTLKQYINL